MGIFSEAHVCQCLSRLATQKRNSFVTISGGRQKTGQQFVESVLCLARGLLRLGLRNGDVVAISAFNSDWYLEWILAVAFIGGIVAPLNYRWSIEEARMAMVTIRPKMLVTDESCCHWHSAPHGESIPSLTWHVSLSSPSSDVINKCNILTVEMLVEQSVRFGSMNYSFAPEGAVVICFTSGTTGRPKGVVMSHTALIVQSLAKVAIVGYSEDDVYLHTTPLCHIGGLSSAMAMLMVGACHIFIPKFEATLALEAIEQHCVTSLITVPAIMADLISSTRLNRSWKGSDSVKKILNGGGGLSDNIIKDAIKLFPRAKLLSAYGMTEACSSLAFTTLFDSMLKATGTSLQMFAETNSSPVKIRGVCVGKPAPHVEIKIRKYGSSNVGKIFTRGPHVMLRYWDQIPEKASDSIEEAWLDTGDIGFVDDQGNLWLVGRTNGRIKSGGENIYPEEVEAVLIQHPGVLSSIVVGIPDPRLAETVVACIRLRENWQWSDDSSVQSNELFLSSTILRRYCREKNLTGFKIPKRFILWRTQFPLTTTGKIRRDQVRREVESQLFPFPSNL
ncbi:2-succinylbenzoate--CoA ligase, chloroplastic/peroxisomal-like isoform X1 [Hibiscus syriacus]|uniref:2-succinylbenzoate--CoA ligase, chloroplastic/peroxisomal-like isoform X1 n=2 Tax=Hibiscus syriacus TaxID=106335 RepID=UPI001922068D|nr:2-succinylbenzoate--CoA ligase, chloroplastic/peroxisomal-like isoform X1 [Hibiscus syriacus]